MEEKELVVLAKEFNEVRHKVEDTENLIMSEEFDKLDKVLRILTVQKYDSLVHYENALKAILIHNKALFN